MAGGAAGGRFMPAMQTAGHADRAAVKRFQRFSASLRPFRVTAIVRRGYSLAGTLVIEPALGRFGREVPDTTKRNRRAEESRLAKRPAKPASAESEHGDGMPSAAIGRFRALSAARRPTNANRRPRATRPQHTEKRAGFLRRGPKSLAYASASLALLAALVARFQGGAEDVAERGAGIGRAVVGDRLLLLGDFERLDGDS